MIRTQYDATGCECLSFSSLGLDCEDLVRYHYRPIECPPGQHPQISNQPVRLFDINGSRFTSMTDEDHSNIDQIRQNFDLFMRSKGQNCQPKEVYRPVLMPITELKTIGKINSNDDVNGFKYIETSEMNPDSCNPVLQEVYRDRMRLRLSTEITLERCRFQALIMGYFASPLAEEGRMPMLDEHEQDQPWTESFQWVTPGRERHRLSKVASQNGQVLLNEYQEFVRFQKLSLRAFKSDARLDDHRFWLDYMEEPRKYIRLLKTFVEGVNALFCVINNAMEMSLVRMTRIQEDLYNLIDSIIDR